MGRQFLYKIFSPEPVSAEMMIDLFGWCGRDELSEKLQAYCDGGDGEHSIQDLPKNLVTWVHEKKWNSYPYLPPTDEFDCFDLYDCPTTGNDRADLSGKLWYTSGIERFISTMETSALSGRNVAALIIERLENGTLG